MRAPRFRYHAARSVQDAVSVLVIEERAMLIAGGTDLVPNMKRRHQTPEIVVDIHRIDKLRRVSHTDGLTVGACTTLTDIAENRRIQRGYAALAMAAGSVATVHLRNMGTLGGNLCLDTRCNYYNQNYEWRQAINFCMKAPAATDGHACATPDGSSICWVATSSPRCWAVSSTDTAPALISLGAEVILAGLDGERRIPVEQLYQNDGMNFLTRRRDEVVTGIHIAPHPTQGSPAVNTVRSTYRKLRRRGSFDFPVLGVAAALRFSNVGSGRGPLPAGSVVETARVVLGAVASHPVLVPETELLVGKSLSDDVIHEFAEAVTRHARPMDNTDFELGWRKKVVKRYVADALTDLREGR
ncbi:MAG TPA: FAD binding domain-containing protein [Gemmatimonadales bacterium]